MSAVAPRRSPRLAAQRAAAAAPAPSFAITLYDVDGLPPMQFVRECKALLDSLVAHEHTRPPEMRDALIDLFLNHAAAYKKDRCSGGSRGTPV